ncbi:MAG TPA: hypothetical protein VFE09_08990 [Rubrobacteraceae bacterium]|nr:hypothetical protein [Rubrobacteraceae bacterium]
MQVIMSTAGRYEVQELEFGQVYKWHPETVVVECDCGERPTLTSSTTTCECGADHAAVVREWLAFRRREEVARPWRYYSGGDAGLPC